MEIIPEIHVCSATHLSIQALRNSAFPSGQHQRSYHKQLPHYRAVEIEDDQLLGYFGLDYRAIRSGNSVFKILGVIDFCILEKRRGTGIGTRMMEELDQFAQDKDVDFIMLISDVDSFYIRNGFQRVNCSNTWLRMDEHKNYGIAFESLDDLFIKPVGKKQWSLGHVDWLGYMF